MLTSASLVLPDRKARAQQAAAKREVEKRRKSETLYEKYYRK
jgi:hypothetical protein